MDILAGRLVLGRIWGGGIPLVANETEHSETRRVADGEGIFSMSRSQSSAVDSWTALLVDWPTKK